MYEIFIFVCVLGSSSISVKSYLEEGYESVSSPTARKIAVRNPSKEWYPLAFLLATWIRLLSPSVNALLILWSKYARISSLFLLRLASASFIGARLPCIIQLVRRLITLSTSSLLWQKYTSSSCLTIRYARPSFGYSLLSFASLSRCYAFILCSGIIISFLPELLLRAIFPPCSSLLTVSMASSNSFLI